MLNLAKDSNIITLTAPYIQTDSQKEKVKTTVKESVGKNKGSIKGKETYVCIVPAKKLMTKCM